MNNKLWTKHLIECKCVLPQYKYVEPIVYHKFVVFSEIGDTDGLIKKSYAQCNNCGVIHKVLEVGKSEILKKEASPVVPKIDEIKTQVPEWLGDLLYQHNIEDISTWQQAKFIYENELWGQMIVLGKEVDEDFVVVKYVLILGKSLYKVETDTQEL